jgi:hypothetical protein
MVDVVMEMDDIDIDRETVDMGRIEMARDKLTSRRIARSPVVAKRKSGWDRPLSLKSKVRQIERLFEQLLQSVRNSKGPLFWTLQRTMYDAKLRKMHRIERQVRVKFGDESASVPSVLE